LRLSGSRVLPSRSILVPRVRVWDGGSACRVWCSVGLGLDAGNMYVGDLAWDGEEMVSRPSLGGVSIEYDICGTRCSDLTASNGTSTSVMLRVLQADSESKR